jgi:dihydrolipoamide dehydrogenase
MSRSPELAIVGAGPGGYAAAFLAADLGLKVMLIDEEPNPGGVCVYRGCIPSKALLHAARVLAEAREARGWGIEFGEPRIDLDRLRDWKNRVVARLSGGAGQVGRLRGVEYLQGRAEILGPTTLLVQTTNGTEPVTFEHAILATGARPALPRALALQSARVLDSTSALEIGHVPQTLLVAGGGYIGLELGTVYAALGSAVTVVDMTSGLLPGVDRDLVRVLERRLSSVCAAVHLNTKVTDLKEEAGGVRVTLEGPTVTEPVRTFETVLVAVGRVPNSAIPGLGRTKVQLDERGFVKVDPQRRTAEPTLFAIGDLVGEPMLAHKASHEGRVAAEAIAGHNVAFEPLAIPAVIFTDPEVAWCGLTETQAASEQRQVEVVRFPWAASGRAVTLDRPDGVTKLVLDPESERILGVGIAGVGAGELIAEGVVAIEMGALASDLKLCIHPHPTLSETLMGSAEVFFGQATHVHRPKKRQ